LAKLAEFACRSKFSDVRLAGLRIILRLGSSSGVEIIRSLCNDRNARVRDVALSANSSEREALLEAARQDFLMGTLVMRRTIAVHTLFALGASDAATLAESAVRDQSVKVRYAALESLIALAQPEQRDRLVLASLRDASRRVRRLGERAIGKGANSPPLPTLIEIFLANPGAMTSLTKAAARLPLWVRLQFLLAMLESRTLGYDSAQTLIDELTSWLKDSTRNYATPAPDQARSLADSWSKVYPVIPLSLAREIADVLNVYRVNR
jgi:HEAT repeat protein